MAALCTAALARELPSVRGERMRAVHVLWSTAQQWEATNERHRATRGPSQTHAVGERAYTVGFYLYRFRIGKSHLC